MQIDRDALTTDKQMVNRLKVNLRYGFEADLWFSSLKSTEKDTYDHLETAFKVQYPLTTQPKLSKTERIRALKEWVLKPEDLGEKIDGPGGSRVYSHVRWANGLASRVRDAEDTVGFALGETFDALPRPVKDLIRREQRTTYKELADTVLGIDIGDLRDAAANHKRDEETARLARAQSSPTKAIRDMLNNTHLQYPQPAQQQPILPAIQHPTPRASTNPFAANGGQGNLFVAPAHITTPVYRGASPGGLGIGRGGGTNQRQPQQPLRNRPVAERHADLIEFAPPQHPDTNDGRAAHRAQCAKWHTENPTSKPDERRQYPLTPGTAPAGSFECWGCGQKGHRSGAGQGICPGDILPQPERDWRRIASFIAREFNRDRHGMPTTVNFVSQSNLTYPEYHQILFGASSYPGEVDDTPGNGQGSSA